MSAPFGRLALHTWTLDTTPLETALDAVGRAGFDAVELRRSDFTTCFQRCMSNDEVLDAVRAAGVPVCCLGVEYGWMFATGDESRRLFSVFRKSCENAVALGCELLMSAPGQNVGSLEQAIDNTRTAGEIAGEYGLALAIEFNSQHPLINSPEVLRELLAGAGRTNCGMLLDAYHLERSGRGGRGFEDVASEEIFAFQFSDVPPAPIGDVKRPTDRLLPGDGIVDWDAVFGLLAEKRYTGHLSLEAPNPATWARSPYEVAAEAVERTRAILGRLTEAG